MIDYLLRYGPVFMLAVAFSFGMTLIVRAVARHTGVVDHPDGFRKVQERPVPRLGGLAIYIAYFGALMVVAGIDHHCALGQFIWGNDTFFWIGAGGFAILMVGAWDDVRGMKARWKLLFITLIAVLMYTQGFAISSISNPFGEGTVELGIWAIPLTLFWFIGCINAMNLIDGLDGLASGVGLFVAATVFVSSVRIGNAELPYVSLALIGVLLGFLVFNFHPASIFLGDSGSLLLGFLIASIGLVGAQQKSRVAVALLIPIIALGLPVMDTMLAILRRWSRAMPLWAGDRQHIHHKLLDRGFSHRQAVLVLYGICFVMAICALLMTASRSMAAAWVLALFGVLIFVTIHIVGRSELKQAKRRLGTFIMGVRRGGEVRAIGYRALERMGHVDSLDALWGVFSEAAEAVRFDHAALTINHAVASSQDEGALVLEWRSPESLLDDVRSAVLWAATVPITYEEEEIGELRVVAVEDGGPLPTEVPEVLAILRQGLAENIWRIEIGRLDSAEEERGSGVDSRTVGATQ